MFFLHLLVQAMHEGGSEMVWSHFDSYSVNKLSQVALRCCMDVENKCAMSHCTLCLGQVRKCVVDIQVLISPPILVLVMQLCVKEHSELRVLSPTIPSCLFLSVCMSSSA